MAKNQVDIVVRPSDTLWVTVVESDLSIYTIHRTKTGAEDFAGEYDFLLVGSIDFGSPVIVFDLDDDPPATPVGAERPMIGCRRCGSRFLAGQPHDCRPVG